MNELEKLIWSELEPRFYVRGTDIEIHIIGVENLSSPKDILMHTASILSDVEEMVKGGSKPEKIHNELEEAKFFIFKLMQYLEEHKPPIFYGTLKVK